MARQDQRREPQPAPPPLPPETRTVGQLVAETIRLYGSRFWRSLALGIAPAAAGLVVAESPGVARLPLALTVAAVAASLSFALATGVVARERIPRRRLAEATAFGAITLVPAVVLLGLFGILGLLPAVFWLGFAGLIVPVITLERRRSYARAFELARADLTHAVGALLYYDQLARVGSAPRRRRRNADVHPAVQPDRAGRSDTQVEPGPAARGQ